MTTLQRPGQAAPGDGLHGVKLLERPTLNKGTAFTEDERSRLGLHGLLPPQVESLDQQVVRAYEPTGARTTTLSGTSTCAPCRTPTRSSSTGSCSITSRR